MIKIGQMVMKIAGRDGGKKAVIVDILDNNFVLIDGETRRRKCNIKHLEPLDKVIKIKKKASHDEIRAEFKKIKLKVRETKPKPKTERPRKLRGKKTTPGETEIKKEKKPKKVKKEKQKEDKKEAKTPKDIK